MMHELIVVYTTVMPLISNNLTLLHSERPKLYTTLAFLSAIESKTGVVLYKED